MITAAVVVALAWLALCGLCLAALFVAAHWDARRELREAALGRQILDAIARADIEAAIEELYALDDDALLAELDSYRTREA